MPPDEKPDENHVGLKEYLETKFSALEKHIDDKFDSQKTINEAVDRKLTCLDDKISTVSRRESYIDGTLGVIVLIVLFLLSRVL